MTIFEPQRGVQVLQALNAWVSSSTTLFHLVSFLADATVLLFPLFLLVLYIAGIRKKEQKYKQYALCVFVSSLIAGIMNIIIQLFVIKVRPETALAGAHRLILNHLPTMSFPSDHAAVSMAFAIAILCGIALFHKHKKRTLFTMWGVFFLIASIIMSIARVAVGVHRPTDILAGWVVGIIAALIATHLPTSFYNFFITIEEYIMQKVFGVKK